MGAIEKEQKDTIKYHFGNGPIRKPLPLLKIEKKTKSFTIPAFRVSEELYKKYEEALEKHEKGKAKPNQSRFLEHILSDYISGGNTTYSSDTTNEIKNLSIQINKIGNNVNQIAHGINILKRKKYLSKEDKENIRKYYEPLKIMSERYTLAIKKILKSKFF